MNISKSLVHCDDARSLVTEHDGYLSIDENRLDIFSTTSKIIPDWQPVKLLPDYDTLPKIYLDIETRNLEISATKNRLYMIGLMNERGDIKILRNDSERVMLEELAKILDRKKPFLIGTYNGMKFDLPVLAAKYSYYNIKSPFWISDRESTFATAQLFGSPTIFHAVHIKTSSGHKIHHIDLYQQVLADDFVKRQLTSYRLKRVPEQWQLRLEGRKELSYEELLDHYDREDWQPLNEYLKDDLRDTKLIGDRLIPPLYYQQEYFNQFPFQALTTIGNGSKWNSALKAVPEYEQKLNDEEITTDHPKRFQGGLTGSKAGFFRGFVVKTDFESLYPSIMLKYGICSHKDTLNITLGMLKRAKDQRIAFKNVEKKTDFTKQMDSAQKPIINCFAFDTLVLTDKGEMPIALAMGGKVKVLNGHHRWSEVEFFEGGFQEIYTIKMKRGNKEVSIKTTANHRWFNQGYDRFYKQNNKLFDRLKTTDKLNHGRYGDLIPNWVAPKPDTDNDDYSTGVAHGVIYGDGQLKKTSGKAINYSPTKGQAYFISLIGDKKSLIDYLDKSSEILLTAKWDEHNDLYNDPQTLAVRVYSHLRLKELPSLEVSNSYLLGFFRGLLATDGTIHSKNGSPAFTMRYHVCEFLEKISPRIGVQAGNISLVANKGRESDMHGRTIKLNFDYYRLCFEILDFTVEDFLRDFHQTNFIERDRIRQSNAIKQNIPWRVISVIATGEFEPTFCCDEPESHAFTLANGILTANSAYGQLAAKGIEFNDPVAASLVTAYGRNILKHMILTVESFGGEVVSSDTDAAIYHTDTKEKAIDIYESLTKELPENIRAAYEWEAIALYSPPSGTYEDYNKSYKFSSANGRKFLLKEFKQGLDIEKSIAQWESVRGAEKVSYDSICQFAQLFGYNSPEFEGLRKNYIIFFEDGSIKANGRYKKRDRSVLQKTFQIGYLKALLISKESADKYYRDIVKAIASHDYPVENLAITRKIRSNEITLVKLGIGQKGDVATFWVGESGQTSSERYSAEHYLEILRKMLIEIRTVL